MKPGPKSNFLNYDHNDRTRNFKNDRTTMIEPGTLKENGLDVPGAGR
jgi:hypothetical protein